MFALKPSTVLFRNQFCPQMQSPFNPTPFQGLELLTCSKLQTVFCTPSRGHSPRLRSCFVLHVSVVGKTNLSLEAKEENKNLDPRSIEIIVYV